MAQYSAAMDLAMLDHFFMLSPLLDSCAALTHSHKHFSRPLEIPGSDHNVIALFMTPVYLFEYKFGINVFSLEE